LKFSQDADSNLLTELAALPTAWFDDDNDQVDENNASEEDFATKDDDKIIVRKRTSRILRRDTPLPRCVVTFIFIL